jgi:ubiquitin-conjugating enzyme E2 O
VWPGTIVAFLSKKVDTSMETNQLQPERVGVVQRVDAAERLARIRWFAHPEVTIVNIPEPCLLSGSRFGILTSNETEESLYEITEIEALNSYLRDVVLVDIRKQQPLTLQQTEAFSMSKPSHDGLINQNYHWIGHVISQGTDGFLTVRLGLLDTALDIRVSVEAVVGFIKPKEFKEEDGEDGEDDLEEYEDIDEEDEDAFLYSTTDDIVVCEGVASQDTETMGSFLTTETEKILSSDDTTAEKLSNSMSTGDAHRSITHRPSLVKHYDLDFTKYPSKPLQFELLDEPVPHDHHFSSSTPILKAALLRRIRKEHSILESSLPEGIWVIAWTENLTLLRVLIVGPQGTPYSLAPFVIDFHFKSDFPNTPPEACLLTLLDEWQQN